ncbi:MAG: organomercurial lyase [Candidatus Zixiibacteriota bacterium]
MKKDQSSTERRSRYELTALEKEVLRDIFKTILASGKAPTVEELGVSLEKSDDEITRVLDTLEEMDLLLRRKGTQEVVSIYPFSLLPTRHQIVLEEGEKLFAMCAVDAVGMPGMFDKNIKVTSQCDWCKTEITIEIKDGEISATSHADLQIWNVEGQGGPDAETCCPVICFFCSGEHFGKWKDENSDLAKKGRGEPLEQAYPDIRNRWRQYGEAIGVRREREADSHGRMNMEGVT